MKHDESTGIELVVEVVLASTTGTHPPQDHDQDLVMLGTLAHHRTFWSCLRWGAEGQRSDFVHVGRPCRDLATRS